MTRNQKYSNIIRNTFPKKYIGYTASELVKELQIFNIVALCNHFGIKLNRSTVMICPHVKMDRKNETVVIKYSTTNQLYKAFSIAFIIFNSEICFSYPNLISTEEYKAKMEEVEEFYQELMNVMKFNS